MRDSPGGPGTRSLISGPSLDRISETPFITTELILMAGTERRREIARLRARRKKTINLLQRVKAGTMEKTEAARKLRRLTPGADVIIKREGLA